MRESRTAQTSLFDTYSQHKFGDFLRDLSDLLDEHPAILTKLEEDLITGGDGVSAGRQGLSVESIFRCLLLKQITGVSYQMLAFHLSDSSSYRSFTRLQRDHRPRKSALSDNIRRIKPQTLKAVFEMLGATAVEQGLMDVNCLRMDSTVVRSNIALPSDSQLLDDGIRVLSRLFAKSRDCTGVKLRLTDYRKSSKSLAARLFYGKKAEKDALYDELIRLALRVIKQSDKAIEKVQRECMESSASRLWVEKVIHYQQLLERVIDQTQRRVMNGETVPASEKIVSVFEPHTDIIIKSRRDIEYGHKINLATDKSGVITAVMIEDGNPTDAERFIPLIKTHRSLYGSIPTTTIADGGYASHENIKQGRRLGIKRVGFHKKRGISVSEMGMKRKTLNKLRDFRAGIEGNISELKRAFGAGKALWRGKDGFMAFVWSAVISYNLTRWARLKSG